MSRQDAGGQVKQPQHFRDSDFWLDINNITLGPVVGRGQFSEVHVGKYFGDLVAIKVQRRENADLEEYLLRELSVLKNTGHENLLSYLGAFNELSETKEQQHRASSEAASSSSTKSALTAQPMLHSLYIITEYCHGGDLLSLLLDSSQELCWKFRLRIAMQAVSAIAYLHEMKLLHRDIKSSNILLDSSWNCKISDFGMSREYNEGESDGARMTICGTDAYMAPEMLFEEEYTNSVDVFSFGMVLLEIMRRDKVGDCFAVREPRNLFRIDEDTLRESLPSDAPPSLVTLALSCIKYLPIERPTAADAFEWLQDLHDSTEGEEGGMTFPRLRPLPNIGKNNLAMVSIESSHKLLSAAEKEAVLRKNSLEGEELLGGDDVRKTGFLFKRATNGFRNWKKVVFVLTGQALCWKSNSTGVQKGRMALRGCTIQRTIMHRFKIHPPTPASAGLAAAPGAHVSGDDAGAVILNRELSAGTKAELDEWMDQIQQVIDELSAAAEVHAACKKVPESHGGDGGAGVDRPIRQCMLGSFGSVSEWLRALDLDEYAAVFEGKGYDLPAMLEAAGLDNDDLDCLGVYNPLHRRLLKSSAGLPYSDTLTLDIPRWRDLGGVIFFCLQSCLKFSTSSTLKRFSDFKTLDSLLRMELRGAGGAHSASSSSSRASEMASQTARRGSLLHSAAGDAGQGLLLAHLPPLPSDFAPLAVLQKDTAYLHARRQALEEYLRALYAVLLGTPHLALLLGFLDLTPQGAGVDGAYS